MTDTSGPKFPNVAVQLTGTDGNAFALVGKVTKALKRAGEPDAAKACQDEAFAAGSYDELLVVLMSYVDVS